MMDTLDSEIFTRALRFVAEQVPKLIADPAGRSHLGADTYPPEVQAVKDVGNFFEVMGTFEKGGIVDRALTCDIFDGVAFRTWKLIEPVAMIRRKAGYAGTWASFEYLAVICEKSLAMHQGDYYPRGARRMTIDKRSLEAAAAFARDKASASEDTDTA
jgi:hypothetical protein